MINSTLLKKKHNWLLLLVLSLCFSTLNAQTAPENTRFMQLNTASTGTLSKSFTRHLNSQKNDLFFSCLVRGQANFFGKQINNNSGVKSRLITRLGQDGIPKWHAQFYPDSGQNELNISDDFACVDKDDNFLFLSNISGSNSIFTDASGNSINFPQTTGITKTLIKVNQNGDYLWSKKIVPVATGNIEAAISTDNNGDVYLILSCSAVSGTVFTIDNVTLGSASPTLSIVKLSSTNGNIIYSKNYNYQCYSFIPVFDSQNNLYVFTEPMAPSNPYTFDSTTFLGSNQGTGHLMLKFNNIGNVIFGKDFYAGATSYFYSWPNDVVFDGSNFILNGSLSSNTTSNFIGLDLTTIPRSYTGNNYEGFFAKISPSGNVLWQKPLGASYSSNISNYTNIDLDENNNFYIYYTGAKNKLNINGIEYTFDPIKGEKVLMKFDTNGNQAYIKAVDYGNQHANIDVFGEDKINVTSFTTENNFLNYPINNQLASNAYVATFGLLDTAYLIPEVNYNELSNVIISNNDNDNNTFSFDLVNNVNWTATSDQPWLTLSYLNLTGKTAATSISSTGDAKLVLNAQTNNTGLARIANITITGNGVPTKIIQVSQTGTLGNTSNELNELNLSFYPNPASSLVIFSEPVQVSIYDITGKLIKTVSDLSSSCNISNLNTGVYLLKGKTQNNFSFTKKLIKE